MFAVASLVFLAAAAPATDPATARLDAQNAEVAYRRCMNAQGASENNATSEGRATNMATTFCRPALESMLQAQIRSVELSDLPDRDKRQLRRRLRESLRELRDEALFPSRRPGDRVPDLNSGSPYN
ncbi:MAG TPA: hypothetical protein VMG08_13525 [Allosphingosinicella sp.]|nr:hypothetical protein [Allosphingosinicella sp.]